MNNKWLIWKSCDYLVYVFKVVLLEYLVELMSAVATATPNYLESRSNFVLFYFIFLIIVGSAFRTPLLLKNRKVFGLRVIQILARESFNFSNILQVFLDSSTADHMNLKNKNKVGQYRWKFLWNFEWPSVFFITKIDFEKIQFNIIDAHVL